MNALTWLLLRSSFLVVLSGCLRTNTVQCGFGACGPGLACDEVNRHCVDPAQLVDCLGMPDRMPCAIAGEPTGVCKEEICVRERCGDGLVIGEEACDGANTTPAAGTCVDFAFDYGSLGCTEICSEALSACRRLGWAFRTMPGNGDVTAIAEDGDKLYVATVAGLFWHDGTAWSGPEMAALGLAVRTLWAGEGHVFAGGFKGAFADGTGFLLHYDGSSWSQLDVAPQIRAVWARSATDAFAVGTGGAIYHFDGSTWTSMTSPVTDPLVAVWGTNDRVFAVSHDTVIANAGAGWTSVPIAGVTTELRDLWGTAANNFYVIEHGGRIHHFDGTAFSPVLDMPSVFEAISGRSASEIYVVGGNGTILLYDGTSWIPMDSPASTYLQAVHVGASKVYAASSTEYFMEYEGVAWVTPTLPQPEGTIYDLWGYSANNLVAVGAGCFIHEYDGTAWGQPIAACATSCDRELFDVWGTSPTNAYAVGATGTLLERVESGWECRTSPLGTDDWLFSVWGSSSSDVFIGGGDLAANTPALAHFNGSTWEDWSSRVAFLGVIRGIWGTGPNDVFVVSENGRVAHYDGINLVDMPLPGMFPPLRGVWGTSSTDVFAVSDAGKILHYDGASWSEMTVPIGLTVPTSATLFAVVGSGPDNVFAAGGRTLLHYDGTQWAPVSRPISSAAHGLHVSGDQLFVVGDHGIGPRLTGRLH